MRRFTFIIPVLVLIASPGMASVRQTIIPLDHGVLHFSDLTHEMLTSLSVPAIRLPSMGHINLNSLRGSLFLTALDKAFDGGCSVRVTDDQLILRFDSDRLPHNIDQAKHDLRIFTAEAAPEATARQARLYGLHLPMRVDPSKPLSILVHGLDSDCSDFRGLSNLLEQQNQQIACFVYPNDQPLSESAALFTEHLCAVHETFPELQLNVIAHSMGALVARAAIEGPDYPGGVRHFILIAPPNHGTKLAPFRFALELREHYQRWRHDPAWSPTWMITDGLGEAGRDLHPNSAFLKQLNALPRRSGVQYTIIAGNQNPLYFAASRAIDASANLLPSRTKNWIALGAAEMAIHRAAELLRRHPSHSDGPVPLSSTRLDGVADYVVLSADHNSLLFPTDNSPPLAWGTIRDRLLH